jgi:hypothetical protein
MDAIHYHAVRHHIRSGDVLLLRNASSLISRIIQLWTGSVYSHAGIAVWWSLGRVKRLCIIEAVWTGVRVYPVSEYLKQGQLLDWYVADDTRVSPDHVAQHALIYWGARYVALAQMFVSFCWPVRRLYNWLAGDSAIPLNKQRWFCSELVTDSLEHGMKDAAMTDEPIPVLTSPGKLAMWNILRLAGTVQWEDV